MYIEKLTIKNLRYFAEEKLNFNWPGFARLAGINRLRLPNVNLIIGNNGTGKTTIFQALTIVALRSYLADNISGFRTPMVIRHGTEFAEANATLLLSPADTASGNENTHPDVLTSGHRITSKIRRKGSSQSLDPGKLMSWMQNLYHEDHPGCFIAAYGASRRTELMETYTGRVLGLRYRRVATLFEPHIGLMPLSMAYEQCQKQNRWEEVVDIVNGLLQPPVRLIAQNDDRGEPIFDYYGIPLPAAELSDGYRLFVGWLIDCLTHLSRVLPTEMRLTDAVGVVIVDEVDMFLAPAWQRIVLESLSVMFPSIQWFCSTHSPLVAGSVENDNIYILEGVGPYTSQIRRPTNGFEGKSVDTVLIELFDVQQPRSSELQRQLSDLAERAINGDIEASIEYLRRLNRGTARQ